MSNVINDIKSAPQTFSSWDNCMQKAYCKYPAIIGIIIASLIALSIVWCIASCLCCGATLCGSCVRCLTCFGCCGMCKTGSGGGRKSRHKDDYNQMPPTPYNGYQPSPAQMSYNHAPSTNQFAQFDIGNKNSAVHEDSLPAMPTWANATSRRVEDSTETPSRYAEDVEMGRMAPSPRPARGQYSQVPVNGPRSPLSPGPNQGYFPGQQHPYQADISTQRIPQHDAMRDNGFQPTPLSPAPTYTTYPRGHQAPDMAMTVTDKFASFAPTPQEHRSQTEYFPNQQQHPQHQHQHSSSYDHTQQQYTMPRQPYGMVSPPRVQSPPSTRYEPSDYNDTAYRSRSISPPSHDQQYHYHRHDQSPIEPAHAPQQPSASARPPSLLQVGRKPVVGSHREV